MIELVVPVLAACLIGFHFGFDLASKRPRPGETIGRSIIDTASKLAFQRKVVGGDGFEISAVSIVTTPDGEFTLTITQGAA